MWSALLVTLPTQPNAVRVRIWRALKALGCAALRDGVYLLPAAQADRFERVAEEVRQHGGTAQVLDLATRDDAQRDELLALFDRTEAYAEWRSQAGQLHAELAALSDADARRRVRALADGLQALIRVDHYPTAALLQAQADLEAIRQAFAQRLAPGEPQALAEAAIPRLSPADFAGRCWATRARPWVDRLACAWLIRRFIDPSACFVWLPVDAPAAHLPAGALGFDFDGARFTHVGSKVSFEVLMASFGLDSDPALQRLARAVHCLDMGGFAVAEAAGLEIVLAGLRQLHADDDALVAAADRVFDAFHAAPPASAGEPP